MKKSRLFLSASLLFCVVIMLFLPLFLPVANSQTPTLTPSPSPSRTPFGYYTPVWSTRLPTDLPTVVSNIPACPDALTYDSSRELDPAWVLKCQACISQLSDYLPTATKKWQLRTPTATTDVRYNYQIDAASELSYYDLPSVPGQSKITSITVRPDSFSRIVGAVFDVEYEPGGALYAIKTGYDQNVHWWPSFFNPADSFYPSGGGFLQIVLEGSSPGVPVLENGGRYCFSVTSDACNYFGFDFTASTIESGSADFAITFLTFDKPVRISNFRFIYYLIDGLPTLQPTFTPVPSLMPSATASLPPSLFFYPLGSFEEFVTDSANFFIPVSPSFELLGVVGNFQIHGIGVSEQLYAGWHGSFLPYPDAAWGFNYMRREGHIVHTSDGRGRNLNLAIYQNSRLMELLGTSDAWAASDILMNMWNATHPQYPLDRSNMLGGGRFVANNTPGYLSFYYYSGTSSTPPFDIVPGSWSADLYLVGWGHAPVPLTPTPTPSPTITFTPTPNYTYYDCSYYQYVDSTPFIDFSFLDTGPFIELIDLNCVVIVPAYTVEIPYITHLGSWPDIKLCLTAIIINEISIARIGLAFEILLLLPTMFFVRKLLTL